MCFENTYVDVGSKSFYNSVHVIHPTWEKLHLYSPLPPTKEKSNKHDLKSNFSKIDGIIWRLGGGGINKYFQVVSITAVILSFSKACLSLVINKQQLKA